MMKDKQKKYSRGAVNALAVSVLDLMLSSHLGSDLAVIQVSLGAVKVTPSDWRVPNGEPRLCWPDHMVFVGPGMVFLAAPDKQAQKYRSP